MSFLFGGSKAPSTPSLPTPPPTPSPEELESKAAAQAKKEEKEFLKKKQRSKTILTGPEGIEETGTKKTILG